MDKQRKGGSRKPISREYIARYLTRFKAKKKQHPIRPRTFLNTQGLSVTRLQSVKPVEAKKPIISNNVKARLESNLQYLLANQNMITTRVKQPESYISLQLNNQNKHDTSGLVDTENQSKNSCATAKSNIRNTISEPGLRTKSKTKKDISGTQSFGAPKKSRKSKHVRSSPSMAFPIDMDSSFDFDTIENQIRANSNRSTAPSLSGVSSSFFKRSPHVSFAPEQLGWSLDEPKYTEPPSISPSHFGFQPDAFGDHFDRSPSNSFDCFETNDFDNVGKRTVRKTRIIRASLSRLGDSPFMEQIVIQKIKYPL